MLDGAAVWREIGTARTDGEYQWALQLLDRLIFADIDGAEARQAKAEVLRDHAAQQINCPTRHYYIQCAKELGAKVLGAKELAPSDD